MSLVFHYAPMSTASITHWVLEELGIPYEKVKHDFKSGELKQPAYLALNPNGMVPTIVHDGVPIFESAAITIYLGEVVGAAKGLYPAPGPRRGQAMQWVVWANVSLGGAVYRYTDVAGDRVPAEQRNAAAAAVARAEVERCLRVLDGALAGRPWILGDAFSIVDAHVASVLMWVSFCGFGLEPYPTVAAWAARAQARPACAATMQE
jgi:glutathione S-transferase